MISPEPFLAARAMQPLLSGPQVQGPRSLAPSCVDRSDEATLHDPDARVPMRAVRSLMARAVETTGDADLGLHLGEHTDVGSADATITCRDAPGACASLLTCAHGSGERVRCEGSAP